MDGYFSGLQIFAGILTGLCGWAWLVWMRARKQQPSRYPVCPRCRGLVFSSTIICPHCGHNLRSK